jgi:hypothetical protein
MQTEEASSTDGAMQEKQFRSCGYFNGIGSCRAIMIVVFGLQPGAFLRNPLEEQMS